MRISDWSSDVCSSDLIGRLRKAGISVTTGIREQEAQAAMMGFFAQQTLGRPYVTLKLATSLDGQIARADGESQWITGPQASAHTHLERARHDAILRSEEHTSELQSLMRISYAVSCLKKKKQNRQRPTRSTT